MINFAFARRLCALAAVAVLLATAAVARSEPAWEVFDDHVDRTAPPVADAMLKLADVTAKDFVHDLGCGDGVIVVMAAKRYGAKAFGIDINPKMVARAKANAEKNNVADKTTFAEGDLYKADLKPATVITLFLWPSMNIRLRPRLLDLAPGVRIVSHRHDMGAWRPDRTVYVYDKEWGRRPLFLWIVPARSSRRLAAHRRRCRVQRKARTGLPAISRVGFDRRPDTSNSAMAGWMEQESCSTWPWRMEQGSTTAGS